MPSTFENAFAKAPIGMALVDLVGNVVQANDAWCRIVGRTAPQMAAHSICELGDLRDAAIGTVEHEDLLAGRLTLYAVEKRYRHAWGHAIWVLLSVSMVREDNQPAHFIAQLQDISARKELEGRLEHLVDHDVLTTLFNGRRFEQALVEETKVAARYGGGGAVLLIDLDHFKDVNDRFGHRAGDDLLKTVAASLRGRIRDTDTLARLGGDEFGIILSRVDMAQAEVVADDIVKALRQQTAIQAKQQIPITASVGVALFDGLQTSEILTAADLAMYEAKEAGRDQFAIYRPRLDAPPRRSSRLAEAEWVRQALTQDQLTLHGQPILDLSTRETSRYELFVRLRTGDGTLLPPSAFLYVAERFGTVVDIDCWVVQQAVALIAREAAAGRSVTLHLNISGKSFGDPRFLPLIEQTIADARVDPSCLVFELTESAVIGDLECARGFMTALQSLGVRFALDDFGEGFGSFSYVKDLPFDYFKIDGDFIRGFDGNNVDQLMIEAVVGIAKGMGRKTIAEFVIDQEMADRLRDGGVDHVQGFHIGVPVPIDEMLARR